MWGNHWAPWNWRCSSPNPSGNVVITFPRTKTDLFQNQSTFAHQSSPGPRCKETAKSFYLLFPTLSTSSSPLCHWGGGRGQGNMFILILTHIFFNNFYEWFAWGKGVGFALVVLSLPYFAHRGHIKTIKQKAFPSTRIIHVVHKSQKQLEYTERIFLQFDFGIWYASSNHYLDLLRSFNGTQVYANNKNYVKHDIFVYLTLTQWPWCSLLGSS